MNKLLNEILLKLTDIKYKRFSDVKFEDGLFSFKYLDGLFFILKEIDPKNINVGILKIYHDTRIPKSTFGDITEVSEFQIRVTNIVGFKNIEITNHIDFTRVGGFPPTLKDGMMVINEDQLLNSFTSQFDQRMIQKGFRIVMN